MKPALIVASSEYEESAARLCGQVYEIFVIGSEPDLSNRRVLAWPNGESMETWAQTIANLPRTSDDPVKLLDAGDKTPADFSDWNSFFAWARLNARVVEPNSGMAGEAETPSDSFQDGAIWEPKPETNSAAQTPERLDPPQDAQATDAADTDSAAQAGGGAPESDSPAHPPGPSSPHEPVGITPRSESPPVAAEPFGDFHTEPTTEDMPPAFFCEDMSAYETPGSHGGWPVPIPIDTKGTRAQPFDIDLAPASIQPFLADCTKRTGIDAGAYLIGALGAISGLCNDGFKLQPKLLDTRWRVHPAIWPIGIGDSSSGKTPGIIEAMQYVQELDIAEEKNNIKHRLDYQYAQEAYDDAKRAARKNGQPRPEAPEPPQIKQYWMDKATPEAVENALVTSRKLVWFMDEWSGLINGIDRYSSAGKGSGGREFVLSLYNGGPGKKTLVSGNSIIPNKSAVLCGGITPSAMMSAAGGALETDGLLQRTFICMVRTMKPGMDAAPNSAAYHALEKLLFTLAEGHGNAVLKLSDGASEVYQRFCAHVLGLIQNEENGALASHLGKWQGMAARMMLIYHLADLAEHGQHPSNGEKISKQTAEKVCSLFLDWQLSHVHDFWYSLMGGVSSAPLMFAQAAARYILAKVEFDVKQPTVRLVDLYNGHYGRGGKWAVMKGWERKEAINLLEYSGWIAPESESRNRDGVPTTFLVNPRIASVMREEMKKEKIRRDSAYKSVQQARKNKTEAGED